MKGEGLTVAQAAERLGLSRQRVDVYIREGRIQLLADRTTGRNERGRFSGGGRLLDAADVERLVAERARA